MEAARSSEAGMVKRSARRGRARWAVGAMGGGGGGGGGGAVERGLHGGAVGAARWKRRGRRGAVERDWRWSAARVDGEGEQEGRGTVNA